MARTVRNQKIDTRSARAKLPIRREPYWTVLSRGCALGYRKGVKGGTWVARRRSGEAKKAKQNYYALGPADDAFDAGAGTDVLTYSQAQERAREWFTSEGKSDDRLEPVPYLVKTAVEEYLADYIARGGKQEKELRRVFEVHIRPKFGEVDTAQLSAEAIQTWHRRLAEAPARVRPKKDGTVQHRAKRDHQDAEAADDEARARRETANKILSSLKAALNYAWGKEKIASCDAWRRVQKFKRTDGQRQLYLEPEECNRLLKACDPWFGALVKGALFCGGRYGEVTRARVKHFNKHTGKLYIPKSKGAKDRHVTLSEEGRAFFSEMTASREREDRIFLREDGTPWKSSHQCRRVKKAAKEAGLPKETVFYTFRHTFASLLVMNGVELTVVAEMLGHVDTRMVDKHYKHLANTYIDRIVREKAPILKVHASGSASIAAATRFNPATSSKIISPARVLAEKLVREKTPDGRDRTRAEIEHELVGLGFSRNIAQSASTKAVRKLDPDNPARWTRRPVARRVGDELKETMEALAATGKNFSQIAREMGAHPRTVSTHLRGASR